MRNLRRRLFALVTALILTFTLLPTTAYARVGNFITTDEERAAVRTLTTTDFAGRQYMVLQNDYITFAVQCSSGSGNELYSYTAPTALLDGSIKNIFLFPMEITRFRAHDGTASSWSAGKDLRITGIKGSNEKDPTVENPNTVITLELTMSDSRLAATMTFYLQRVDLGQNDSAVAGGQHWGVDASTRFRLTGDFREHFGDDSVNLAAYQSKEYPLSTMGHKSADAAPLQMSTVEHVYTNNSYRYTAFYTQTLSDSLGLTGTSVSVNTGDRAWINRKHTEVYTTSYVCGNPFVAMSSDYYGDTSHGLAYYPQQVESNGGKVTTYNTFDTLSWVDGQNSDRQDMFWGFRNLYASGDTAAPTEPDRVTVSGDKLYIIPDGDKFRVTTAASNSAAAVVRGKFTLNNGVYNFTGGAAALSPTVTATWGSGGYFRIKSDGTIEHSGVNLNAPSFKFYKPKSGADNALGLKFTGEGLEMTFDPTKNDAIFALNIPYASAQVKKGTADINGNLTFSGEMGISTIFDGAEFKLEELGYGLKNNSFTVNGVHATGSFKTANLIGLELMEVSGEINTFQGQESYGFELELDVFSLFEAKAELELKRFRNGSLMPNNLYFYVAAEPGIPLVPPVPTTFITGGGAGFYGLADTANGDWFAIPPIKLRGSVGIQFVKLLEASPGNIVFGPSTYEVSSDDVSFAGVDIGFSGGYGMYLNGDKVTYNRKEYKGLTASGKIWMKVDLPSETWNFLTMDGEVAAGIFGGMSGYDLYMRAYGNSRAEARIQTPNSWGKLIGGKKLAGVGVDAAVVGETWINGESKNFDTIINKAIDSMKLQVGLAGTTTLLGSGFRVWVIVPDAALDARKNWNWGYDFKFLRSLPRWSWDDTAMNVPSNANAAPMLMAANADDVPVLLANGTASKTITISDVEDEQVAYLVLSFPENTELDLSKVVVTKDSDSSFSFTPEQIAVDSDDVITNAGTANIYSDVVPLADGTGSELVLIIKVGTGSTANGTYTVSLGENDSAIDPVYSQPNVVSPADRLSDVTFGNNGSVSGSVEYPDAGTKYVVRTYLGTEKGGTDYLVDERDVENNSFNFTVSSSGTAAPTGSYYLTTYLMKEVSYTDDSGEKQTGYIAIGYDGSDTQLFSYTNENTPAVPTDVTLKANGNETMVASWKAPSDTSNVDGYKITIYEQNEKDEWVDSGYGYEYDATQFQKTVNGEKNKSYISGLSIDENGNYTIDMAVTMGGRGATKDDPSQKIEGVGEPEALEANKSYKVGVSAYNSEAITIGDDEAQQEEVQTVKYYGAEAQNSDGVYLPEYTPLVINIKLDGKTQGGESVYKDLSADDAGIYNAYISSSEKNKLQIWDDAYSAAFTVTRMNDGTAITGTAEGNTYYYSIPNDFEGALMLEVTASVTDSRYNVTDTTTYYVLVCRDDVAPIVTLDSETFYTGSDTSGFTITGVTEPGATVSLSSPGLRNGNASVIAGADGTFSISDALMEGIDLLYVSVGAKDAAGNVGRSSAMVNVGKEPNPDPDPDPDPVTPGSGSGGSTTYPVSTPSDVAGGTVTVSPKNASRGATVTVTVTPDDGYKLDALTVTDAKGNRLTLTDKGGGKYTFTMPAGRVMVAATFVPLTGDGEEPCDGGADCPSRAFTDLSADAWYHGAVDYVLVNDIMGGCGNGLFAPDGDLSRAQLCQILYNREGRPVVTGGSPFADVEGTAWYADAVLWAAGEDIVGGYGNGLFGPEDPITREQLAVILWRYAGSPAGDHTLTGYTDTDEISSWAMEALLWANGNGVLNGDGSGHLMPKGGATRAQTAQMIKNFMEHLERGA